MRKLLASLAILGMVGAYVAFPILCVKDFITGIKEGDGYLIAENIDIPAVTDSIVQQFNIETGDKFSKIISRDHGILGVVGGIAANIVIENVAERLVAETITTTGLGRLMGRFGDALEPVETALGPLPYIGLAYLVSVDSPTQFRISSPGSANNRVVLVFRMEQWEWKLRDIRLPKNLF
jgi:hypothetical protein